MGAVVGAVEWMTFSGKMFALVDGEGGKGEGRGQRALFYSGVVGRGGLCCQEELFKVIDLPQLGLFSTVTIRY